MSLEPPPIPAGFLQRWCSVLAESSESPPGAFLPTGLALLSAIAAPRMVMRWGIAHEERCNLWTLNVGMSALAKKTSGISGLFKAVHWLDGDLIRMLPVQRISDAGIVSALDVVSHETAAARKLELEITPKGSEPREIEDVVRPVPLSWVALFNEVAPVWCEDGAGWAMDAQRTLLSIYDGHLGSTTKATAVPAQECCVTALGNIPPGVLAEKTTLGMLSSGWVGRWLVIPTPPPTEIVPFPMPNGTDPLIKLRAEVESMMALVEPVERCVVNDMWSPEAIEVRREWYTGHWMASRDGSPDDPFAVAAAELFGRLQATALKVATLLAFARQADSVFNLREVRVEPVDVLWASDVIDRSMLYVTDLLREAGAAEETSGGKAEARVLRYLERQGATHEAAARRLRDVVDSAKSRQISYSTAKQAVEALMASGHIVCRESGGGHQVWLA